MDIMRLLAEETGLAAEDISRIVWTAPSRYKSYEIPKRSGGMREIAQPARELKYIQRILIRDLLSHLPVHQAAKAYRPGLSIRDNAILHAGSGPILKMDFRDFFPSIRSTDWIFYCLENNILDLYNANMSAKLFFRRKKGERVLKLSIGAPSSPMISNILLFNFDDIVDKEAKKRGIVYTRYADDMTFSGQRVGMLKDMLRVVPAAYREIKRPRLRLNDDKTTFITASHRRTVTGVTLSNDGSIGLGQDRKRLIRAKVHHALDGKLDESELKVLVGELAFANVIEPAFLDRLRLKYGTENIEKIKKSVVF